MSVAVILLAALAALFSYRLLEDWSRRSWLPALCRAGGWSVLALLLLNASCPSVTPAPRPVVLLDASLSMNAAGGRWVEALAMARSLGDVRLVGAREGDSLPASGHTLVAPALAGAGSGRGPVVLITDGEVEDADAVPPDLLSFTSVRVLPRRPVLDYALVRLDGPARLTVHDTLRLVLEVRAFGGAPSRTLAVTAAEGDRIWLRGAVPLDAGGNGRAVLSAPLPVVAPGPHLLRVALVGAADSEPRDDARLLLLTVVPTPGVVLLASPPSWESRFLLDAVREVSALPVVGYLETESGRWRRAGDLRLVATDQVARAAAGADLLVTVGPSTAGTRSRARGRLHFASPSPGTGAPGDWYLNLAGASPLSGAFIGLALDSFPPGTVVTDLAPGPRDWVGLTAQAGRRGAVRPVIVGRDSAGVRRVLVGVDGLWRWSFRGGSSEQGYRSLVAAAVTWLLGGTDSASGRARLRREVVEQGRPVVFEWVGPGAPVPTPVTFAAGGAVHQDTLVFDGAGRAELFLSPGAWQYRLGSGGAGTVAVETYSSELLPAPRTLAAHEGVARPLESRAPVRGWVWLFGVGVVAFAGEWLARRRMGLR